MNIYLEKLEYNKILEILSTYAVTYLGKSYCLDLLPSNNEATVRNMLLETEEAVSILYRLNTPPVSEIVDNTINIKKLEAEGSLSIKSILELNTILVIADKLKKYFYTDLIDSNEFKSLDLYFSKLYSNSSIIETINKSIVDESTLDDNASKELSSIRKKQRNIEQDIKNKLNSFIHSSKYSKYIQENIITIRNNRFVIPVKEEFRGQIKGFIHDISSSGSTVFIEPLSVFDLNNELSNLKIEENIEIEKILQKLSNLFSPYINEINLNIECIGKLDFIFAKAKYSKAESATTPTINSTKEITFKNARHPLLDKDIAVPISLSLGKDFTSLIITGPNTGGKTVSLKTIGLLNTMACSGLNITAENSSIFVFDSIFADIGDDQSISASLSTFSSHIKTIIDIINNSTKNSLVLLDELGAGTDPIEGAALAISILEFFKEKNSLTVSTTHYQEIKQYALINEGFENASVEFDINTLSPTYNLLIGVPGKSNAFEISKKLGLNENIINNARSNLTINNIDFEESLKSIYDNKIQIEKEKALIEKELESVSTLRKSLEHDNSKLIEEEKQIINNAKLEAKKILIDAKEEASEKISEINKLSSNRDLNKLRNELNEKINDISISYIENNEVNSTDILDINEIKPNARVFVKNFNKEGIIISNVSRSNEVQVQIGSIKAKVNINNLEKSKDTHKEKSSASFNISKTKTATTEINVIGLTVDEAIFVVDKFLDDSYLAKLKNIRIVHGKGTGKLREGIHRFLKNHSQVKSFRIGTFGEGEMGVTIVELK